MTTMAEAFLDEFARIIANVELNQRLGTPRAAPCGSIRSVASLTR